MRTSWSAVQHFSNKTGPNILVNVISLIIESIVKDSTADSSDAIAHVASIQQFYMVETRSARVLKIKGFALCRCCNCRYYCWADKSILCRNCALRSIPAIWYIDRNVAASCNSTFFSVFELSFQVYTFQIVNVYELQSTVAANLE